MPRVGVLQQGVDLNRGVAHQHVAQVTEFEIRIGLDQQHADLLLAHRNGFLDSIVVGSRFVVELVYFDNVAELADLARAVGQTDRLGPPVGADFHGRLGQDIRLAALAKHDTNLAVFVARAGQLRLEIDDVVDKHHVVDQQVGQFQIADRSLVTEPHGEQRDPATSGTGGGVFESRAVGVDAVGEQQDARRNGSS